MVRLARRKTGAKRRTRYSIRRAQSMRTKGVRKKARTTARKARRATPKTPIYVPRIKSLINNMSTYAQRRRKQFGAKDSCAKKLSTINKQLNQQLRKSNVINPNTMTCLKKINPTLRGITAAPKIIRTSVPKLQKFLRQTVYRDVNTFLKMMKRTLSPMHNELQKLQKSLNSQVRMAKNRNVQLKVNPALRTRFNAVNRKLNQFKIKWNKRLNKLATHGNASVRQSVKAIKKQLDQMQSLIRKNYTILNRYANNKKTARGKKVKPLFSAGQAKVFESRWNRINTDLEKSRKQVESFFDGLKAVK